MKTLTKKGLMAGGTFFFNNATFQEKIESDDVREASVFFRDKFMIMFNGSLIHSSKTFSSLENKLNKLITDWHLTESEEL